MILYSISCNRGKSRKLVPKRIDININWTSSCICESWVQEHVLYFLVRHAWHRIQHNRCPEMSESFNKNVKKKTIFFMFVQLRKAFPTRQKRNTIKNLIFNVKRWSNFAYLPFADLSQMSLMFFNFDNTYSTAKSSIVYTAAQAQLVLFWIVDYNRFQIGWAVKAIN